MKTVLSSQYQLAEWNTEIRQILRSCVHCGFCTAVCPTYQLLSNELDSPRGRIYLIHSLLQGNVATHETQHHLDLCLTCRSCETACPSGVRYAQLADVARNLLEQSLQRPWQERWKRWGLRQILPYPKRFKTLLQLGRWARPWLSSALQQEIPIAEKSESYLPKLHPRKMLVLSGCVQPSLAPQTNVDTAKVLDRLGISLLSLENTGCCGAVDYHLGKHAEGLHHARRLIDAWYQVIEQEQIEAIVVTASGCGSFIKEYGELLRHDTEYAPKAQHIAALTQDLTEVLAQEDLSAFDCSSNSLRRVAVHQPCTLQHGQKLGAVLENLLIELGFNLVSVADSHLCCGSAGTYSILNKTISQQLLTNKLQALQADQPELIVTANIGCQMHLQTHSQVPVKHWISLLADAL
ncbi:MAG: glycolate oxidase subunit GlcF [Thiotrichaceae bacterium]